MTTTNTSPVAAPAGIDLDKLEALARAATPGLWTSGWPGIAFDEAVRRIYDEDCHTSEDAAFIAAANPATVLELIAQARAARPGLEYMTCCNHPDCTTCKGFGGHYRITSAGQPAQHRADGEERAQAIEQWRLQGTTAWYDVTAADKDATLGTHTGHEKRTVYRDAQRADSALPAQTARGEFAAGVRLAKPDATDVEIDEAFRRTHPAAAKEAAHADELRIDYLADKDYLAGLRAGWNLGVSGDNKKFDATVEAISKDLREARRELQGAAQAQQPAAPTKPIYQFIAGSGWYDIEKSQFDLYNENSDGSISTRIVYAAPVAAAAPAAANAGGLWVSVDADLPEVETDVLVRGKRGDSVCHAVAGLFNGEWLDQNSEVELRFVVSHWMPLPPNSVPATSAADDAKDAALGEIFAAIDEAQRMNRYNESSFQIGTKVARLKCLADEYRAAMQASKQGDA